MIPQIDRMITSEHFGNRNLVSSNVQRGSTAVMTSGADLSQPQRRKNVQYAFGGSGMSSHEWTQLHGAYKQNEGLNLIFKVDKAFVDKFQLKELGIEAGHDLMISKDGTVVGPHLSQGLLIADGGKTKKISKIWRNFFKTIMRIL